MQVMSIDTKMNLLCASSSVGFCGKGIPSGQRGRYVVEGEICMMAVDVDTIRKVAREEILRALREDSEVRRTVWLIAHSEFTGLGDEQMHQKVAQTLDIAARNDIEDVRP